MISSTFAEWCRRSGACSTTRRVVVLRRASAELGQLRQRLGLLPVRRRARACRPSPAGRASAPSSRRAGRPECAAPTRRRRAPAGRHPAGDGSWSASASSSRAGSPGSAGPAMPNQPTSVRRRLRSPGAYDRACRPRPPRRSARGSARHVLEDDDAGTRPSAAGAARVPRTSLEPRRVVVSPYGTTSGASYSHRLSRTANRARRPALREDPQLVTGPNDDQAVADPAAAAPPRPSRPRLQGTPVQRRPSRTRSPVRSAISSGDRDSRQATRMHHRHHEQGAAEQERHQPVVVAEPPEVAAATRRGRPRSPAPSTLHDDE